MLKNLPAMQETWVRSLGQEDPLEKEIATLSSILAWRIPWTVARQWTTAQELSRQEYWSGLPFPSPGDLPNPGIEPMSLMSPASAGRFFTTSSTWRIPGTAQLGGLPSMGSHRVGHD